MILSLTLPDMPPVEARSLGDKAMFLDKAITHGKEKRKPYRGAKAVDKYCRNHGSCIWCRENRLHRFKKSVLRHCE